MCMFQKPLVLFRAQYHRIRTLHDVTGNFDHSSMNDPANEFDDADLYGDLPEFAGPESQQSARAQQLEKHIDQLRAQVVSLCEQVGWRGDRLDCVGVGKYLITHAHRGIT